MQFGKYRLIRKLATGGMAEIFLARQDGIEGFQKDIVIKRILPVHADNDELIDMFLDEARIAATLNHPNIAHIFDLGRTEGEFFIAMEYIHGQDLRRICERGLAVGNFLPLRHAARIIADSAAGLHYAHNQADTQGRPMNIVHRDVSPQNITVSFDGVAKLLDFGIAKAANKIVTTRHGQLKGKYAYMSPEQCNGLEIDHRSDIFSLGTLLYEITVCTRLFRGETDIQTIKNVSEARITPPSEVRPEYPRDLEAIVLKALAADPHNRYQSARELQEALEDFLQNNRMKTGPVQLGNYMREIFPDKLAHPEPDPELVGESPLPVDETAPTNLWPAPEPETADLAEPEAPSAAPTAEDIRAWTRGDSADMASPEELLASTPTPAPMPAVSAGPPGKPRPGGGAPRPGGGAPRPGGGAPRPEKAAEKSSGEAVSFVVNQNAPYKVDADVKEFKRKKGPRKVERSAVKTVEYQLRSASDDEPDSYEKGSRIYFYILGIVVVGMLIYAGVLIYQKGNPLAGSNMLVEGAAPVIDAEPEPLPPELPSTLANIGTNPPGAAVVVNGILQSGETPGDFKVIPGQINSVSLFLAGHKPIHRNIAVPDSGSPDAMSVTLAAVDQEALNPEEDFGKLTIESEPPGAAVVLNGQASGSTPFTLEKAIGGQEYHVVLRKQGFREQIIIQHVYANADNRPPLQKLIPDDRKTADRFTELNIEPREVTINLNDDFVGRGPRFIQRVRNEAIRVELKDDGYHPWRRVLTTTVAAITVNPGLKKINRDPGKLSIKLTPSKNIMVFVGSEQYEPKELKKLEMPAGEYTVTLVKEDRSRGEVTVAVEPGIQRNWEINFEGDKPVATSKD